MRRSIGRRPGTAAAPTLLALLVTAGCAPNRPVSEEPRAGVLRTPEERFLDLPGYPFAPRYAVVDGLRVHYLDEGRRDAAPVVLLHGEPSWSYLYRRMIPVLTAAGHRVIAPDLVGFGRSDKPVERSAYTYARLVEWTRSLLFDELALDGATLFAQDWGGLIGLRLVAENPDRFACVVVANTGLPTGDGAGKEGRGDRRSPPGSTSSSPRTAAAKAESPIRAAASGAGLQV